MSDKITVITRPGNRITINNQQKQSIRSVSSGGILAGGGGVTYLIQLGDVDVSGASNNETLVYDEVSGKYIVKELPIINGGTF